MATLYFDQGGATETPIEVEVITHTGERLGYLGRVEEISLTWNVHEADVIELVAPLDSLSARLADQSGATLVRAKYRGMQLIAVPTHSDINALEGDPAQGMITVTAQGGWQMLTGMMLIPYFAESWGRAGFSTPGRWNDTYTWSTVGPLSNAIKQAVKTRAEETAAPILTAPLTGEGRDTTIMWEWQSVADGIMEVLPRTEHYVDIRSLMTGDMTPDGTVGISQPTVWVDVKPYRRRDIVWSVEGGDVIDWNVSHSRAQANRVYTIFRPDDHPNHRDAPGWFTHVYLHYGTEPSRWNTREEVSEWQYPDDQPRKWSDLLSSEIFGMMENNGLRIMAEKGASSEIEASIDATFGWVFGPPEEEGARVFSLGDLVRVELPAGDFELTVKSVEVRQTPSEFTVTPTVAKQDAKPLDTFDLTADLQKRVMLLERGAR
ncbi:hypothetical protein [Corynebacterium lubricantis]|uniref:hypothetical protein n=1 Tax=Corynebacterium lubricantis TaxID=541095 RepID=UPI00037E137F|nr:hypothetical protein [Corynebacterium lubricantis]